MYRKFTFDKMLNIEKTNNLIFSLEKYMINDFFLNGYTSQNIIPQNILSENIVPQNIVPQNIVPQNIVSQNIVSQNIIPQNIVSQNIVPQNIIPQNILSENIIPQNILSENILSENIIHKKNNNFENKKEINDKLFWLFYKLDNSLESFEMLGNINIVKEKQEKIKYIDIIRENKKNLKNKKINKLTDVENELVNENKINIKTFLILCIIKKLNILYVDDIKRVMFESINNESNDNIYIVHNNNNKYYFSEEKIINKDDENVENIEKSQNKKEYINYKDKYNYFLFDNIEMKLKCISSYKVLDLLNIKDKLKIKDTDKKNKKELYEMITLHLRL
jgi:hypothetical protein